jgi:hypothetical protein
MEHPSPDMPQDKLQPTVDCIGSDLNKGLVHRCLHILRSEYCCLLGIVHGLGTTFPQQVDRPPPLVASNTASELRNSSTTWLLPLAHKSRRRCLPPVTKIILNNALGVSELAQMPPVDFSRPEGF